MANPAATFADGTIGRWLEESRAVFAQFCDGPTIAIGSSMGGWISLLLARDIRAGSVQGVGTGSGSLAGLVLIAPAVDFTEVLMWQRLTPEIKKQIETTGSWQRPSEYSDEPYLITTAIDRGRPQSSAARRPDRNRLSGAHPAGRQGRGRAVGARGRRWCRGSRATTWC